MHALKDQVRGAVRGRIACWDVDEQTGRWSRPANLAPIFRNNQLQYSWGLIAAKQLGYRRVANQLDYSIAGMYIEFANVAAPDDKAPIPSYDRSAGLEYYSDLLSSGANDFLRVTLTGQPELAIEPGFEAFFNAANGEGNLLNFFAISSGTVGMNGKTFSDTVNSTVIGAALVAMPVAGDWTQDVIFARGYLPQNEQAAKLPSQQAGIAWPVSFE